MSKKPDHDMAQGKWVVLGAWLVITWGSSLIITCGHLSTSSWPLREVAARELGQVRCVGNNTCNCEAGMFLVLVPRAAYVICILAKITGNLNLSYIRNRAALNTLFRHTIVHSQYVCMYILVVETSKFRTLKLITPTVCPNIYARPLHKPLRVPRCLFTIHDRLLLL